MNISIAVIVFFFSIYGMAQQSRQVRLAKEKAPLKVINIMNAMSFSSLHSEKDFAAQLNQSCVINNCSHYEKQKLYELGKRLVHCQLEYLQSLGIQNSDTTHLCRPQQAIFTCDSLATPLMRKMCYTANRHSLRVLRQKEIRFRSERTPASK